MRGQVETIPTIIKLSQNTEKSPVALRTLDITQTPLRNNQLTLVWKTLKSVNNNNNNKKNWLFSYSYSMAQSAWAAEDNDCTSAES